MAQKVSLARLHVLRPARSRSDPTASSSRCRTPASSSAWRAATTGAKEALYRRYVRAVWSTALRLMGTRRRRGRRPGHVRRGPADLSLLRKPEALRPWLLQIVVHQAHRRFRRRHPAGSGSNAGTPATLAGASARRAATSAPSSRWSIARSLGSRPRSASPGSCATSRTQPRGGRRGVQLLARDDPAPLSRKRAPSSSTSSRSFFRQGGHS